jgi:hypothetical protein
MPGLGRRKQPKLTIHITKAVPDDVLATRAARNQAWIDECIEMNESERQAEEEFRIEAMLKHMPSQADRNDG